MTLAKRTFPDGRIGMVLPITFGRARLGIGDEYGFDDVWCFDTPERAIRALVEWDGEGEPEGWIRHPMSGRRRPNGNPEAEYVMP